MKRSAVCCAVLLAAGPLGARGQAQSGASGPATLDTLLQEVRLLRKAIEKQGVTAARTQLLMGRIALQDQRVARARDALERLDTELAGAERGRDGLPSAGPELARHRAEAPE